MIEFKDVSFNYGFHNSRNGVEKINFNIKKGEVVLLCGTSGCGKTTITRLINGLIPNYYEGNLKGEILIDGISTSELEFYDISKRVGSVFQNPRSQFFNVDTTSELAFGCENMGIDPVEIDNRLERVVTKLSLEKLLGRSLFNLSGGEKQKIACGSVAAMLPDIFVLDEPSSNLDVGSIRDLVKVIKNWKSEGKTIIIAEHRLYYLMSLVDRIMYMKNGKILFNKTREEFLSINSEKISNLGLRSLNLNNITPLIKCRNTLNKNIILKDFYFSYKKHKALDVSELTIPQGEIIGILGNNGAGKSTLAKCLCGLEKHMNGKLIYEGKEYNSKKRIELIYMVMQDVNHQLFTESVLDEVLLSMPNKKNENIKKAERVLKRLNIYNQKEEHPMSLSGGQKQRVAISSAIASEKPILILDEPTSGLDFQHMNEVANHLLELCSMGKTILLITHDFELVSKVCSYVVFMEQGRIKWSGKVKNEFNNIKKFFVCQ